MIGILSARAVLVAVTALVGLGVTATVQAAPAATGPAPVIQFPRDRSVMAHEPVRVTLFRLSSGAPVTVTWGDGATTEVTGGCAGSVARAHPRRCSARVKHAYTSAGTFTIRVSRAAFRTHQAVLEVIANAGAPTVNWQDQMLATVNDLRTAAGAPPLTLCARLTATAQDYATLMATTGHYGHVGPDGSEPWDRMTAHGYQWRGAAENIAAGFDDVSAVMDGWRNSPGHYANIVDPSFEHVGFGWATGAKGQFGDYWVQNFGAGGTCS